MNYKFQECKGFGAKKLHRLSYQLIKRKNVYWSQNFIWPGFPKITGLPEFKAERMRPYTVKTRGGDIVTRAKIAPKKCFLGKIINHDYSRLGAPQIKIVGAKGEGKSVLLNLIMALQAAKGIRILTFNDRRMEIRSLAAHGWFDNNDKFHPFEIDIFVPKDYEFKKGNPLWDQYDNVQKREFTNSSQIIDSMRPHKITVVHEEVFTAKSKLLLWNDLVEQMAEEIDSKKIFSFTHHELSRLIPETPTSEINKQVKRAADNLSNFRKDRIGLCSTFHMDSEVFYRIVQKLGFKIQKSPIDKNRYNRIEKEALGYTRQDFAIKAGGRGWMKHSIKLFPEIPDEFRLVPQRKKLIYPSMKFEDTADSNQTSIQTRFFNQFEDEFDYQIASLLLQGKTITEISKELERPRMTITSRVQKLRQKMKNTLKTTTSEYTQTVTT